MSDDPKPRCGLKVFAWVLGAVVVAILALCMAVAVAIVTADDIPPEQRSLPVSRI